MHVQLFHSHNGVLQPYWPPSLCEQHTAFILGHHSPLYFVVTWACVNAALDNAGPQQAAPNNEAPINEAPINEALVPAVFISDTASTVRLQLSSDDDLDWTLQSKKRL